MSKQIDLRTVNVIHYISALREGGSLPALALADDHFKYVLKFRGAGHGVKALIAELLGGLIAHKLALKVPELVFANLDPAFGRTEADEEIQDLLKFSQGLNLGLHFLSGAFTYDPLAWKVDGQLASEIVWLDAFITNVDRTFRNTNMLIWHNELWLIDHGASFYFHHSFTNWEKSALTPFALIKDHVLLPFATDIDIVDQKFRKMLTPSFLQEVVQSIPLDWLIWEDSELEPEQIRQVYYDFLSLRLENSDIFVNQIKKAKDASI
ncbi:HipA family kinase [Myroides sp. LJL115]